MCACSARLERERRTRDGRTARLDRSFCRCCSAANVVQVGWCCLSCCCCRYVVEATFGHVASTRLDPTCVALTCCRCIKVFVCVWVCFKKTLLVTRPQTHTHTHTEPTKHSLYALAKHYSRTTIIIIIIRRKSQAMRRSDDDNDMLLVNSLRVFAGSTYFQWCTKLSAILLYTTIFLHLFFCEILEYMYFNYTFIFLWSTEIEIKHFSFIS